MPPNFTGRKAELQTLSDWLTDTQHPLFVLRALGGFGKSALTWHWITHQVKSQQWPQVVWWSFYEEAANFNNFLRLTLAYLTGQDPDALPPRQQLDALLRYLQQHPVLMVMDGFERELRAYSGMGAAYQGDEPSPLGSLPVGEGSSVPLLPGEQGLGDEGRDCLNSLAETFLRGLANLRGKVLMSTRLRPRPVEVYGGTLLAGCYEKELTAMQPDDAVEFFARQGIVGNRSEIEQACGNYGFHPLSLRLLAGYIAQNFEYPGDIRAAANLDLTGDLVQRRNHVLERSYENLSEIGQQLLGRIACFRSPVAYGVLAAIEAGDAENPGRAHSSAMPLRPLRPLQANLRDLINRGLVQQDNRTQRLGQRVATFDLHPIVRRYAYSRMTGVDRTTAHGQLRDYFAAVPASEKVTTLDDLTPVIELYHHMVRSGQYDETFVLFRDRITNATYYQLGAYQLQIELLRALFPQGEDQPPQLKTEDAQAWTLNALANSYSLSGQPRSAVPLFEQGNRLAEKAGSKKNLAIGLGNLAIQQISIGALEAAEGNLRRSIALGREIEDEFKEAVGHRELGRLLAYRGAWAEAEGELATALELFEKENSIQAQGVNWVYRSLAALLRMRMGESQAAEVALAAAERSLELADEDARTSYPVERDYVQVHWLLGAAHRVNGNLAQSDTHLSDALTRCRTINLVEFEADILLDLARLRADQGQVAEALSLAQAALDIADRSGYVLQGADVQLFLAQQALAQGNQAQALTHAQIARQLATCDGGDYVYRVAYDEAGALLAQLSG
jgi:tetratricopeptide (TPR) repeat protein